MNKSMVIVYGRVSTDEQFEKGYGLDSQIDKCLQRAKELGFSKKETIVITDHVSGATLNREGLLKIRKWVASEDKPEMIIIYDPDRLSRNLTHQLIVTDEIVKQGVQLQFVNFEWKNTPEGMMYYQLRGIFAQYEREKIRERTIRGRIEKIKKHGKLSYDPRLFGYTFDTVQDELIVNQAEAPIVKLIFQWACEGASGEKIARRLAESGIPAPRGDKWYGSTVTRILHNTSYLGTYMAYKCDYHQGTKRLRPIQEQFPIKIESLIDQTSFDQAQQTIASHRVKTGRPSKYPYLVSGLGKCFCGRSMVANVKSGNRKYTYYTCVGKHKKSYDATTGQTTVACDSQYWNSNVVDEVVWNHVEKMIINPNESLFQLMERSSVNEGKQVQEYSFLQEQKQEVQSKKHKLLDLFMSEQIDQTLFHHKLMTMNEKLDAITARLAEIEEQTMPVHVTSGTVKHNVYLKRYQQNLKTLSFPRKKEIVNILITRITFNKNKKLHIAFTVRNLELFGDHNSAKSNVSEGHGRSTT